ncbi:MAG TPA: hypothetical protein VGM88_22300 [Kofleriaceae bacterium]
MLARPCLALVAVAACHSSAAPPPPPPSDFTYYLLAMTWSPATKDQCSLPPALTLHGLWPNFSEAQAAGKPHAWPEFCGAFAHCAKTEDAACAPGVPVPPELAAVAPAYVSGTLATHEWSKHGSCTRLAPAEFFAAELAAIRSIPTIANLRPGERALADLQRAFGVPPESVVLGCSPTCQLTQVAFCLGKDAADHPTGPVSCTPSVSGSDYDNGCAVRHCDRVQLAATCGT